MPKFPKTQHAIYHKHGYLIGQVFQTKHHSIKLQFVSNPINSDVKRLSRFATFAEAENHVKESW